MAALGSGELYARWRRAKEVLVSGSVVLETDFPTNETELYGEVAIRWRAPAERDEAGMNHTRDPTPPRRFWRALGD